MKILLVGIDEVPHIGRSFRIALEQLNHEVVLVDERLAFSRLDRGLMLSLIWRLLGRRPAGAWRFNRVLLERAVQFKPELVLVVKGTCVAPSTLYTIRQRTEAVLVNYSTDHPFNPVVSNPWIVDALPLWDVYATPRRATIPQLQALCSGQVVHLPFAYDPMLHYPEPQMTEDERRQWGSDVAFVGGCDRDRVPFLDPLASDEALKVSFYGGHYKYTSALKRRRKGLAFGHAYRLVLGSAKVALCLVRRANQDGHVMRTFEIPACGAFMLAERTDEHQAFFAEDREAAFFSTPVEMLDKVNYYVRHSAERDRIAQAGHRRVVEGRHTYRDRLVELLTQAYR